MASIPNDESNFDFSDREIYSGIIGIVEHSLRDFVRNYDMFVPELPALRLQFVENYEKLSFEKPLELFNEVSNTSLVEHGLTGSQMRLKFVILKTSFDDFERKIIAAETFQSIPGYFRKNIAVPLRKSLSVVLKMANVLLGSMIKAGFLGLNIIEEFKGTVESTMELAEVYDDSQVDDKKLS